MASLTGGTVVRRDLLLPPPPQSPSSLYGPPVGSRPPEHRGTAADDEFKMKPFTSAPNGFSSNSSGSISVPPATVGCLSVAPSSGAPMMKTCFWCGYSSIRVSDLMTHMKSAHPQEYSANEAEAPASSPGTGTASSSPQCLGSAPSPSAASAAAGALQPATTASDDGNSASARRYKCFSCEARFCRSGTLVDHMRRNHPEVCQPQPSEVNAAAASPASTARRPSLGPAWPPPFSASGAGERGSPAEAAVALSSSSSSTSSSASQSSISASRKRPATVHQQPSESSTAEDDEDDDDLDIKVIRLVSQRGSCADGGLLLRSAAAGESAALLGRLRASGWPAAAAGHFFRSGAGSGGAAAAATALASVEQKDIGSLLGALRAAGAVDMSGRGQYGSSLRSSPDSGVALGSGGCADGSAVGMQGDAAGPCPAPAGGAGAGSIHLVRVSGVTAGLVGIGGVGAGAAAKVGSSSLDGGTSSNGGPNGGGGGGLRAPEKYKCFWCDAHFRKRGKLMDHIDLFHKDSKQQTEVQAELLTSNGGAPVGPTTAADLRQQQQRTTGGTEVPSNVGGRRPSITGGLLPAGGCKLSSSAALAAAGATSGIGSTASAAASTAGVRPAQPPTCRFVLRAATRVECEPTLAAANGTEPRCGIAGGQHPRTCRFYFGKLANPLTVPGGWPFGPHLVVRAGSGCGLPCPPQGTPAAAAAAAVAAMNFGLTVGPPPSAVAAYGAPYAVYCANGVSGGGVRFYAPHSFLSKRSDAVCGAPFAPAACLPSAYGRAAGSFVGGQTAAAVMQQQQGGSGGPERLLVPVHEAAAAAAAAAASLLHRGPPPPKADSYAGGAGDAPLDLSSRSVRL